MDLMRLFIVFIVNMKGILIRFSQFFLLRSTKIGAFVYRTLCFANDLRLCCFFFVAKDTQRIFSDTAG